jgi:uncharacterized membrane protein
MPSLPRHRVCPGARPCPGRSSLDRACAPGITWQLSRSEDKHDQPNQSVHALRGTPRIILLLNTLLLMMVAFLPFTTSVLAGALRSGHGLRTAAVFYAIAFDATALTFNAVWQYARRHRLLKDTLDPAGRRAIGRRFQLALAWLAIGALLGLLVPLLGVAVIAAFNVFFWLPIQGESPRPQS